MAYGFVVVGVSLFVLILGGFLGQMYLPPPKPSFIGIDLGTTYSCVGVYYPGSGLVEVLNTNGKKCIPSIVSYQNNGSVLIGYDALAVFKSSAKNTIYDAKRFIGRKVTDDVIKEASGRYPFTMTVDKNGTLHYQIDTNSKTLKLSSEEIGAEILKYLRKVAEHKFGRAVFSCVLSVPADFDDNQRNATKRAAALAGLNVLRIINEPTAAAMAYGLHRRSGIDNVLVVDFGGGTLDVSLLTVQGGMFVTQAMSGNNFLGGEDITTRIYDYLVSEFVSQNKLNADELSVDIQQSLKLLAEEAKLNLTSHPFFIVQLSSGLSQTWKLNLTRDKFESLNDDLFEKVLEPIQAVLSSADLIAEEIDEVVLVGGSTRIPKVRKLVAAFFKKAPNVEIEAEQAVTYGVAIQAGILAGSWPLTVSAVELPRRVKKINLGL